MHLWAQDFPLYQWPRFCLAALVALWGRYFPWGQCYPLPLWPQYLPWAREHPSAQVGLQPRPIQSLPQFQLVLQVQYFPGVLEHREDQLVLCFLRHPQIPQDQQDLEDHLVLQVPAVRPGPGCQFLLLRL